MTKVETLTKKVNTLQAKLATASTPTETTPVYTSRPSSTRTISPPALSMAPVASSSRTPTTFHAQTTPNSRRIASGSAPPRPKTPEARVPPPPVFKARTPESKRLPPRPQPVLHNPPPPPQIFTTSSSSSLGKKRRAPDDFEDGQSLPTQGFTVDSMPSPIDTENTNATTPRVRRALQAVRSGFTPVRSHPPPQHVPTVLTSPARRATTGASLIADVTNSPRGPSMGADRSDAKAGKRGWLGKIRGAPANAPRSVSARPAVFDRQTSGGSSR